jgi:E3 ubiquitin-protein ligase HERC4
MKKEPLTDSGDFSICNFPWILNTFNKACLLQMYNTVDWEMHKDAFLLVLAFNNPTNEQIDPEKYQMEICRNDILAQSLKKIVQVQRIGGRDPLRLPLRVYFKNEPAIDEGGVKKEYFFLILRELFDPQYGMFKFNEDTRVYWFNGGTFEPNINFELVGTLMGIAMYNNMFVDIPIAPACYKQILGQKPDLSDMAKWQPDVAKSLQYILDYDEAKEGKPLEDVVCRTFTVDFEQFGELQEIELIPDGKNTSVTTANREEFVRLFVEYEFDVQCAQ